jgi:hemoglobin
MSTSLYERLGETEGIRAIVNTALEAHLANPLIQKRYEPGASDPEHWARVVQHAVDFFSAGAGGPATYQGKSMVDAHAGMNINAEEFVAVVDDIMAALGKHDVDESTQKDVLAILYSLKPQIVHL